MDSARGRIGIVGGSGPEAAINLCARVIEATREQLGEAYDGDLDAPMIRLASNPILGHSIGVQ